MNLPARLSFVTLGVRDLDRATRFYEALGWRRSSRSVEGEVSFFKVGGDVVLALWGYDNLVDDTQVADAGPKPGFPGVALAINVDSEDDVVAALAAAEVAGARILKPGTRAEWGGFTGYFADPDGHPWEVAWNPGYPFPD